LLESFPTTYYDNPVLIAEPLDTRITVVSDQVVSGVNFGNYQNGEIRGRKWNDLNGDGTRDANEPYINNWSIELFDASGNLVETTQTTNLDLNGDGTIDPETETGWYQFSGLRPAEFFVQEVVVGNWVQSGAIRYDLSSDGSTETPQEIPGFINNAFQAWQLDQEFQFVSTGNDWLNWGSEQEKWIFSQAANSWAYVTQTGSVYEWDGQSGRGGASPLDGELLAEFDADYYNRLDVLYSLVGNPPTSTSPAKPAVSVLSGRANRGFDFGNFLLDNV